MTASIHSRLTELFIELADARRALERCPEHERKTIANRIVVILAEIERGQALVAKSSEGANAGSSSTPSASRGALIPATRNAVNPCTGNDHLPASARSNADAPPGPASASMPALHPWKGKTT